MHQTNHRVMLLPCPVPLHHSLLLHASGYEKPPITLITQWSKLVLESKFSPIDAEMKEISASVSKEGSKKRLAGALKRAFDSDLEVILSQIDQIDFEYVLLY
jgi:hypothetical protein